MPTGIPKGETLQLTYTTLKGEVYYITSKPNCESYFLYKNEGGKANKIAKGSNPPELEKKYIKNPK